MPALPSSLALTTIADGSPALAADVRNNYAAIQTAVNGLITALSGGTAGQLLSATSSSAVAYTNTFDHGCRANISSAVAITNGVLTVVTFNGADSYDTDAYHDPAVNNSRMTVPTGLGGKYQATISIGLTAGAIVNPGGEFRVNGATAQGYVSGVSSYSGGGGVIAGSGTLSLAAGDYVEFFAWLQTAAISTNSGFFSIQKVG